MTTVIIILAAVIALIIGFGVSGMWLLRFLAVTRGAMNFCPASTSMSPSHARADV